MLITITEHVDDVRHDVDVAHGQAVVSLSVNDRGRTCGYAAVFVAVPVARAGGVAVILGDVVDSAPDPVKILVRDARTPDPTGVALCIRRAGLPVLVRVDPMACTAIVLRRIRPEGAPVVADAPAPVQDAPAPTAAPSGQETPFTDAMGPVARTRRKP